MSGKSPSGVLSQWAGRELASGRIRADTREMHSGGMTRHLQPHLTIVGRRSGARLESRAPRATQALRNAAYRRFTAAVLGLDVATLGAELRAARLRDQHIDLAA
jgi:hypothetical protein